MRVTSQSVKKYQNYFKNIPAEINHMQKTGVKFGIKRVHTSQMTD